MKKEMERRKSQGYDYSKHLDRFRKTQECIQTLLEEGTHFEAPKIPNLSQEQWEERLDATLTYLFSVPDISLHKTGEVFGHGREWTRQARDSTTKILFSRAIPSTQERYGPFEDLELNKPRPPKETIVFAADQEKSRRIGQNKELINKLKKAKTDEEIQKLLDLIPRSLYSMLVKEPNPLIMPIKTLSKQAELHIRRPEDHILIRNTISSTVPMSKTSFEIKNKNIILTYYFIYAKHQRRAIESLLENKALMPLLTHPVLQVAGPPQEELPTTTSLKRRIDFRTIGNLFFRLEAVSSSQQNGYRTKLLAKPDLPIPIYYHDGKYLYSVKEEDSLINEVSQLT